MQSNIKIQPKFYKNPDNNHCLQASIMIVMNTLMGEVSWEEVNEMTEYEDEKWTWGVIGALAISGKIDSTEFITNNLNYAEFISRGSDYLKEYWGNTEVYNKQKLHSSPEFIKEKRFSELAIKNGLLKSEGIDVNKIGELLDNNLLIALVDPMRLDSGNTSDDRHWVVLFDKNDRGFFLHDPGPLGREGVLVCRRDFLDAFRNDLIVIPKLGRNIGFISEVGRNDPCLCGSGKKYKKCHGK